MITSIFWIIPLASVLALAFAWYFFRQMMKESEGTELMIKIASFVREGAMSYLKQQYKVVASVFVVLVILFSIMAYGFHVQNEWVPIAFLTGGFFSGLAGLFKATNALLSGNPVGLAYGAVTGTKAATNFINGIRGNTGLPGNDPGPVTTSDSNARSGAGIADAKSLTDISTGLLGSSFSRTPTIDYFTAIARSKQGAKSTVLGGGTGVSPTSTSLLGV